MADENTEGDGSNANVVSIHTNANRISIRQSHAVPTFPKKWKAVCRDILDKYRDQRRIELGYKNVGWSRVRDEIMATRDKHNPDGSVDRDSTLSRQDVEAWIRGSEISDSKFQYIDRFIRKIDISGAYAPMARELRAEIDKYNMSVFSDMYQSNSDDQNSKEIATELLNSCLFSEEIDGAWYRSIAIKTVFVQNGCCKAIICYLPTKIESLSLADFENVVFYEAFVIPFLNQADRPDRMMVLDKYKLLIKAYSAEFKGQKLYGYADGEIIYTRMQRSILPDSIILEYPSPILMPDIDGNYEGLKPSSAAVMSVDSRKRDIPRSEMSEREQEYHDYDFYRTYRFRINFYKNQGFNRIIEEMIDKSYVGYVL